MSNCDNRECRICHPDFIPHSQRRPIYCEFTHQMVLCEFTEGEDPLHLHNDTIDLDIADVEEWMEKMGQHD